MLKQRSVRYLVEGMRPGIELDSIREAAEDFERMARRARELAASYTVHGPIALIDVPAGVGPYDKTELLLLGQELTTIAVVADGTSVSIAAPFTSGLDFVTLLELGGGMPTRVSVPRKRLDASLAKIRQHLAERERGAD